MSHNSVAYYCSFAVSALFMAAAIAKVTKPFALSKAPESSSSSNLRPGQMGFAATLVVSLAATFIPIQGLPLARYLIGFNANFSIPLLALVADGLVRNGLGRELLRAAERKALWYSAALIGIVFYPLALGFGQFDPYAWGWRLSPLFAGVGLGAAVLIWRGNRCGFVLLAAIAAWQIGFLESRNYWDYLLDPILVICALAISVKNLATNFRVKTKSA